MDREETGSIEQGHRVREVELMVRLSREEDGLVFQKGEKEREKEREGGDQEGRGEDIKGGREGVAANAN